MENLGQNLEVHPIDQADVDEHGKGINDRSQNNQGLGLVNVEEKENDAEGDLRPEENVVNPGQINLDLASIIGPLNGKVFGHDPGGRIQNNQLGLEEHDRN